MIFAAVVGAECSYVCWYVGFGICVACSIVVCRGCSAAFADCSAPVADCGCVVAVAAVCGVVAAALVCALAGSVRGVSCSAALAGLLTVNRVSPLHGCPCSALFCDCLVIVWYCSAMSSLLPFGCSDKCLSVVCQLLERCWANCLCARIVPSFARGISHQDSFMIVAPLSLLPPRTCLGPAFVNVVGASIAIIPGSVCCGCNGWLLSSCLIVACK